MLLENNLMLWGKIALFWIIFSTVIWIIGNGVSILLKRRSDLARSYIWGMVTILATEEIVFIVCSILGLSFSEYYIIYTLLLGIIGGIGLYMFWRYILCKKSQIEKTKMSLYDYIILVLFLIVCISVVFTRWGGTTDDTYYMGKANEIIRTSVLTPNVPSSANGYSENSNYSRSDVSSLIVLYAYLAKISRIDPVIIARTVASPLIVLMGVAVIIELSNCIYEDRQMRYITTILSLALIVWIKNGSVYQAELFWIKYPWYGIAIIVLLIWFFISQISLLYKDEKQITSKRFWIGIILINFAILQSEIVGVFIIPVVYLIYGIPLIIRKRAYIFKACPFVLASLLPELVCGIYIFISYFSAETNVGQEELMDWGNIVYGYFLWGGGVVYIYFAIYSFACLYFLIKGNEIERGIFVFPAIVLGITFANPLLFEIVASYVTTKAAYYRIFFCLPIYFVVASFCAKILFFGRKYFKRVIEIGILVLIIYDVYLLSLAETISNPYKAPKQSIELIKAITDGRGDEEVRIVACDNDWEIRIYSPNIIYTCSKYSSMNKIENTGYSYLDLYYAIGTGDEQAIDIAKTLGTKYVVYGKNTIPKSLDGYPRRIIGDSALITIDAN